MADRWMDERDRRWRDRDDRRSEDYGRSDDTRRFEGGEDRTWGGSADDDRGPYGARWSGPDRDRVFGERETGMGYGGEDAGRSRYGGYGGRIGPGGGAYGEGAYGRDPGRIGAYRGEGDRPGGGRGGERPDWQEPDYGGVSPAMEQGEYDLESRAERYEREHGDDRARAFEGRGYRERRGSERDDGGRYYGDAGRERIYREEWSQGRRDSGAAPRGYDAGLFDRDSDHPAPRGDGRRTFSGGTGGYDYERGYGDGGRNRYGEDRYARDRGERFERGGREAGEWFRRAGERVASWFGGDADRRSDRDRGYQGMGPKGYQRPDERINEEAHERLTDDSWLDASNISVSVSGGEVTLSGTVDNREAKHRAERMIEDISGVKHVQNNLRVQEGHPLTSAPRGYGDSVLQQQMREADMAGKTGPADTAKPAARTTDTDAGKGR